MAQPPGNKEQGITIKRKHFHESTKSLFMDSNTADFWFKFSSDVHPIRIPVHKAMLAKESEVFRAMFFGEMKEQLDEVEIIDANDDEFIEFAQFFYSDRISITINNLPKLMYLAKKYLVNDLLKVCDDFIIRHLPLEKLILGCDLADLYNRFELKAKLEIKISENAKKFFATDGFRECSHETLESILDIDQLMCDPKDVFDACIDWAKNARENFEAYLSDMENIKKQLGECLYRIPFYLMSSEQITQIVNDYEELFDRGSFKKPEIHDRTSNGLIRDLRSNIKWPN
ncbi:BTB/POZ domain-containing protein 3-like [Bradysia coprophila]|uniref:BTB/POZ domain-containing protein 3-like n=1 Tax=Bradysia coprophila TaxID=38358 RepID=UPI00187DD5F4|nr:BTB/POZ domain-containing protein 3-like [Bradysia coprophila]